MFFASLAHHSVVELHSWLMASHHSQLIASPTEDGTIRAFTACSDGFLQLQASPLRQELHREMISGPEWGRRSWIKQTKTADTGRDGWHLISIP